MRVLKFGETSMENAKLLVLAAEIVEDNAKQGQVITVLSSTTYLLQLIQKKINIRDAKNIFSNLLLDLVNIQPKLNFGYLNNFIELEFNKIRKMLNGIKLLKNCPDEIYASIIFTGGKISVVIMAEILKVRNNSISIINPVKKLLSHGNYLESKIDIIESSKRIKSELENIKKTNIILMIGSIAGNKNNEIVLLGNDGSNYSAAALAACINAEVCEIWTNIDGLYSCDLSYINNAKLLKSISYTEAVDLAYFGCKIFDLRTAKIFNNFKIPCLIKNIYNVKSTGTLISNKKLKQNNKLVKSIVSLSDIVMLNISGPAVNYILSVLSRIISFVSNAGILIFSLIQTYSEPSISFYILEKDLQLINQIFNKEFELQKILCNSIKIIKNLGIISIIGDEISNIKGVYNKIFSALEHDNISIKAILHNHSKSSISIVINGNNIIDSVKIIYYSLFVNNKSIEVFLIGVGGVGKTLLNQIHRQQNFLKKEKQIELYVYGIANSQKSLTNLGGIELNNWQLNLCKTGKQFDINEWINLIKKYYLSNPVIVDCTSSQEIANQYTNLLSHGFHVVTSNKKANTSSWYYYQQIRFIANNTNRKFLYETNVGAGLPVIENLKSLLNSGDQFIKFSGILSGSLSFIFGKLDEGLSISEATDIARKKGYTEPDPREDLSGNDVARKILILARELGYKLELKDIKVEPVVPKNTSKIENFMKYLSKFDNVFKDRVSKARNYGKVLRFVGTIQKGGICEVKIDEVSENNPLYKVKDGENALAFYSSYYQPIPLLLRGYGAGNDVTAAGVFADLLHTLS
ncbi:bifunctional aspartate kinase/homoserine dehydrogenase I [Pantoea sp. SoEX]|uniref:bifunctional aspartate kinase/homoserine dehydrogenase I n=1 Tax=Pantoea sp. SoEX TaxID=2576763 RepID=UPI0013579699|nr:bifunctional aspartate kinase/homoserine dehydrogenase I [Pantoea sp. SoEX]MXP51117.1 bifunctional aspartate kinase/homoserine dehydrogenase I [Pantoea sp. SoEX]